MRSILIAGLALGPTLAHAQTLIRDTEIEAILTEMTLPLMEAGGVDPSSVRLRLVQDPSVNAFVTSTRTIYLHTGLIARLDEPDMLQAVIAHELGHIIGGHAAARGVAAQAAGEASAVGVLAGVLVGVVAGPGAGIAVAA
ncbi:MAG: M48 family metalloprotease, partial [Pseudomonadota bacterium]